MLRFLAALLLGEALLLSGVAVQFGWPLACIAAGIQVVPIALFSEYEKPKRGGR